MRKAHYTVRDREVQRHATHLLLRHLNLKNFSVKCTAEILLHVLFTAAARLSSIVALDDALAHLSKLSPRQGEVVELKYFGGLTVEEIAEALKISPETVMRDWRAAKAWLHLQLSSPQAKRHTAG